MGSLLLRPCRLVLSGVVGHILAPLLLLPPGVVVFGVSQDLMELERSGVFRSPLCGVLNAEVRANFEVEGVERLGLTGGATKGRRVSMLALPRIRSRSLHRWGRQILERNKINNCSEERLALSELTFILDGGHKQSNTKRSQCHFKLMPFY